MPVPHNWYATNRRISSPTVTRTRPTAPITVRTGPEATSGLLPRLLPRERFAQVRGRFVHSSCFEAPTGVKPVEACVPLVVRLRSAVCLLGRFPALAGVDLDVEAGEVVLLSGANGSGKTTLLRLCAGLLPLRSGHAEVLGVDLAVERRTIRRYISLVGRETVVC